MSTRSLPCRLRTTMPHGSWSDFLAGPLPSYSGCVRSVFYHLPGAPGIHISFRTCSCEAFLRLTSVGSVSFSFFLSDHVALRPRLLLCSFAARRVGGASRLGALEGRSLASSPRWRCSSGGRARVRATPQELQHVP